MSFNSTTAIMGENNSGKSAFLAAIDLFFSSGAKLSSKDFSDEDVSNPIEITIAFSELTPDEVVEFDSNLIDGKLIVTRVFLLNDVDSGKYFVSAFVNSDFSAVRAETNKSPKRKLYEALREAYVDLPKEKNADEIDSFLEEWEENNPNKLTMEKVATFKGWTNVASGKLKKKTSFVMIKAVQDAAANLQESKSSPVKILIDTLSRQTFENSEEFKKFILETNERVASLTDPKK